MQKLHSWRSALSYATVAALALNILGGVSAFSVAHASGAALQVSEINWAGSTGSANDTWVEVYNQGPDYAGMLSFCTASGTTIFDVTTPSIPAGSYFVVTNNLVSDSLSSVNRASLLNTASVDLSNLPTVPTDLVLVDGGCSAPLQTLDTISENTNTWAALPGGRSLTTASSMERIATNGNLLSSWMDAAADKTVGKNFKANVSTQFGTPGSGNAMLSAPQNATFTPAVGTFAQNSMVTLTATVDPATYAVEIERVYHNQGVPTASLNPPVFLSPAIPVTPDANNAISVSTTEPTATLGVYDFYLRDLDGAEADVANRSILSPITAEPNEGTTAVITTASSSLDTPAWIPGQTPLYTNQMQVTLNGKTDVPGQVIILDNGQYYTTVLPTGSGLFSVTSGMLPINSENDFTAITQRGMLYSAESTAAVVWQDSTAPSPINKADVTTTFTTMGNVASLTGGSGTVTLEANGDPLTVHIYADAAKTTELVNAPAGIAVNNSDGSFAFSAITNSTYPTVYVTVKDQAGNESTEVAISNPGLIQNGGPQGLNPTVISLGSTQAVLGWSIVSNADHYLVEYNQVGQSANAPVAECVGTTAITCTPQVTITGLTEGTTYNFSVAAVDAYGNISSYSSITFTTTVPAPVITTAVATTPPVTTTAAAVTTPRSVDQVTTTTTPTPTPSATPDAGQVKSATTTATTSRDWTPWIVLLILLAIAVLATIGYFYWFGGEVGDTALAATLIAKQDDDEPEKKSNTDPNGSPKTDPPPKSGKSKRW